MNAKKSSSGFLDVANGKNGAMQNAANGVAAFFDLDGTLVPPPSLEARFLQVLRYRQAIGAANYFRWFLEAVRLAPSGINRILHANKMYLRRVRVDEADARRDSQQKRGERSSNLRTFFLEALERMAWHAERGHAILLVSGTLQALAMNAAAALEAHLAAGGVRATIGVYATRLESRNGLWTGRIAGEAMYGEAKARAIKVIAASRSFDLEKCFVYGDSANDRWMLECVGRPVAVNPSNDLTRIANRNGWPILRWNNRSKSGLSSPNVLLGQHGDGPAKELHEARAKAGT
jgi:HAD superfamily hydrolase (TIGR01490 family)